MYFPNYFLHYKRVQPVNLISLSCDWVILLNEIDQICFQILINPTGIVMFNKNFSETYVCQTKNIIVIFLNGKFTIFQ